LVLNPGLVVGVGIDVEPMAGEVEPVAGLLIVELAAVPVQGRPLAPTRPEPLTLDPLPVVVAPLPGVLKVLLCVLRTPELVGELVELAALGLDGVPGVAVEVPPLLTVALAPPVAPTAAGGMPPAAVPPVLPVPAANATLALPKKTTAASKAIRCLV
jgi:hypothetical protein